jgi:ATP:ADP antiporter, AAA family
VASLDFRRLLELRSGEGRAFGLAFGLFGLVIGGHTLVETARDTLFLTRLPPERLAFVYVAVALGTLLVTPLCGRLVKWVGARNALVLSLLVSAFGTAWFRLRPPSTFNVFALYVFAGLAITMLVALYWILVSGLFTAAQGRRLFGPLAAGGVLGAVLGALSATLLLMVCGVRQLLAFASAAFVVAAFVATFFDNEEEVSPDAAPTGSLQTLVPPRGRDPFVWRVALIVALSTALSVVVDYVFKARAVSALSSGELAGFFAGYHLLLNAASLVLQLFLTGPIVARLGVLGVSLFSPIVLLLGAAVATTSGAALSASVALRGLDGALRNSVQRVGLELLWAPIARQEKTEAKALVDGIVTRGAQAIAALGLLWLTATEWASLPRLTGIAGVLAALWLAASTRVHKPYLELFKKALGRGEIERDLGATELDLGAVQVLIEALARPEAEHVIAAMNVLAERGRARLIPALILYHESPPVLERALELFSQSKRHDWFVLGERLLNHPNASVRIAAVRALALAEAEAPLQRAAQHVDPQVQARAALYLAQHEGPALRLNPRVKQALAAQGPDGVVLRLALIEAMGAHPSEESPALLLELARDSRLTSAATAALAVSADARAIGFLIERLAAREDRAAAQAGLVRLGAPAFQALVARLEDPETPARLSLHLPLTIAEFRSPEAVQVLLAVLSSDKHSGFVRYKALRGLQQLALGTTLPIPQKSIVAELVRNAREYLLLFSLSLPLRREPEASGRTSLSLVLGLLQDKLVQARDRLQRLVQIAQRTDDVPGVFAALESPDRHERARAAEYLDALARGWDRGRENVAQLLGLVVGEWSDAERVRAAAPFIGTAATSTLEVLERLIKGADPLLSSFAAHAAQGRSPSSPPAGFPQLAEPKPVS